MDNGNIVVVGSIVALCLLAFGISVFQQWRAEKAWIEKYGPIPDGYCLVYKPNRLSPFEAKDEESFYCELEEVMPHY